MNRNFLLRYIVYIAVFTALVFVATIAIAIPMPTGVGAYINFGDIVIFLSSALLGPIGGAISGALGAGFADLVYAPIFVPLTIIVKGIEGFLTGLIVILLRKVFKQEKIKDYVSYVIAFIIGAILMVGLYYIGTGLMLGIINEGNYTSGFATALLNLPNDLIQGSVSIAGGYVLTIALRKIRYIKNISLEIEGHFFKKKQENVEDNNGIENN